MSSAETVTSSSPRSSSPGFPRTRSTGSSDGKKIKRGLDFGILRRDKEKRRSREKKEMDDCKTEGGEEDKPPSPHPRRRSALIKVNFGDDQPSGEASNRTSLSLDDSRPGTAASYRSGTPASLMDLIDKDTPPEPVSSTSQRSLSNQLREIDRLLNSINSVSSPPSSGPKESGDAYASLVHVRQLLHTSYRQVVQLEDEMTLQSESSTDVSKKFSKPEYKKMSPEVVSRLALVNDGIKRLETMSGNFKKRIHQYSKAQKSALLLKERITQLEAENGELMKENASLKLTSGSSTDLDVAELQHDKAKLLEALNEQKIKLEQQKINTRIEKERLVLKLFEIESLSLKADEHQLEKEYLAAEHSQIFQPKLPKDSHSRARSTSPEPGTPAGKVRHRLKQSEAELQMKKAKTKQLELQVQQAHGLITSLLDQRAEVEVELAAMKAKSAGTDLGISLHAIGISSSEVESLKSKNLALQRQIEEVNHQSVDFEAVSAEKTKLASLLNEKSMQLESIQKLKLGLETKNAEMSAELKLQQNATEELKQMKLDQQHLEHERDESIAASTRLQQRINNLEIELSEAYEKVKYSQKDAIELKMAVQECQMDQTTQAQELDRMKAMVSRQREMVIEKETLLKEVDNLKLLLQKQENDIYQLQEDSCAKDNALEGTTKQMQDSEQRMMELQKEFEKLEEERCELLESLKKDEKLYKDEKNALEKKLLKAEDDHSTLKVESESLRKRLLTLTDDLSCLLSDKRALEKKVETLASQSPLVSQQMAELTSSKDAKDEELRKTKEQLSETKEELNTIQSKQQECESQIKTLSMELEEASQEKEALRNQLETLKVDLERETSTGQIKDREITELIKAVENHKRENVKGEEDYKQLEQQYHDYRNKVESLLNSSSQLKADNMELFKLLEQAREEETGDTPSKDELFQRLREENEKLERQVSLLSQWNEQQRQDLTIAEENLTTFKKKYQESVERMAREHATTIKQYKIELEEKNSECSRLQRKLQGEAFEEFQTRIATQQTLLTHLSQQNSNLQEHIALLTDKISSLGEDPPQPEEFSFSAPQEPDESFSPNSEPSVKGKEVNRESREKIHEKEKDKSKKTLFKRRSRSAGPSNMRKVRTNSIGEPPSNGEIRATTEPEDIQAENVFLKQQLKELQARLHPPTNHES